MSRKSNTTTQVPLMVLDDIRRRSSTTAVELEKLRVRAGLSMDELAKAMGYAGQSSIQRYLSPDYTSGFRADLVERFVAALVGRGTPPVQMADLSFLRQYVARSEEIEKSLLPQNRSPAPYSHFGTLEGGRSPESPVKMLFSVYGNVLEMIGTVDADGIPKLKEKLDNYLEILKLIEKTSRDE